MATSFQFDASCCSDGQDPSSVLEVRWDWESDGIWDTDYTTTKTADHQYSTLGTRTVALEVKDTGGETDAETHEVVVANTAPTACFSASPDSGGLETNFQFDASCCTDTEEAVSALRVRWDWENDGTWDTDYSVTKSASHHYTGAGIKTITLEAQDTGDLTGHVTRTVKVTGAWPMPGSMTLVPAGSFIMGDNDAECGKDEREITLTHSFYLGQYEVTNQRYRDALQWAYDHNYVTVTADSVRDNFGGSTELLVHLDETHCQISFLEGTFTVDPGMENRPMVEVSWCGAAAYCDWLSLEQGLVPAYDHATWSCNYGDPYGAAGYRLPTDAEWEFAAQYDDERIYPWGNADSDCSQANCCDCVGSALAVASYPAAPAALGLYDMVGNASEWCNDWFTCDLGRLAESDPVGPAYGTYRVVRGAAWFRSSGSYKRIAYRLFRCYPWYPSRTVGFRCARSE